VKSAIAYVSYLEPLCLSRVIPSVRKRIVTEDVL